MKDIFSLFLFGIYFELKIEDNVCVLFLELKLKTKPDTGKETYDDASKNTTSYSKSFFFAFLKIFKLFGMCAKFRVNQ